MREWKEMIGTGRPRANLVESGYVGFALYKARGQERTQGSVPLKSHAVRIMQTYKSTR